jgi:hypothetical protein
MTSETSTSTSSITSRNTSINSNVTGIGGRGRGRNGNRGRGQDRNRQHNGNKPATAFKGHTIEMNGHVFECFHEGTKQGQFTKTLEALGEYIAKNIKNPGDMMSLTEELTTPTVTRPNALDDKEKADVLTYTIWLEEVSAYTKRLGIIRQNMKAVFAVIWGQCSESLKDKVKSLADYKSKVTEGDCVWLLTHIKAIMLQFEGQRSLFLSLADASRNLTVFRQNDLSLTSYKTEFENLVDVFEHYGGVIGSYPALISLIDQNITDKTERIRAARNQLIGMMFLSRADRRKYGALFADLENQYARGNDQYPKDLTESYGMLVNYKPLFPPKNKDPDRPTQNVNRNNNSNDSVSEMTGTTFLTAANISNTNTVPGTDGILHPDITCFACQLQGHYSPACPTATGIQHLQINETIPDMSNNAPEYHFTFTQKQAKPASIPNTWILLDSQSTVSVFNNSQFLHNIRASTHSLKVSTNGGTQVSTQIGDIMNFGTVWYNPSSLANILSLAEVRRKCRCVMDTAVEAAIHVHKKDGTIMSFKEFENGLYFYDVADCNENNYRNQVNSYSFILSVDSNKAQFHRREIEGADQARALYKTIGRPSQKCFEHILEKNLIRNCPVTVADAKRAVFLYGPDIGSLQGKLTRTPPEHVPTLATINLPESILEHHKDVTVSIDIFYVNKLLFFHSISRKLKIRTVSNITSRHKNTLLQETLQIVKLYESRGFNVVNIHADIEFECLRDDLLPINCDITPNDAHVSEVERSIRTIKERVRGDIHELPYKRLTRIMIVELVRRAVRCLNQFPAMDGVSSTISPFTMLTGKPNQDYNHMSLDFGTYLHVFEDNNPTNSTMTRSTGAIALNPTGNALGVFFYVPQNR